MTPVRGITLIPEAANEQSASGDAQKTKTIPEASAEEIEKANAEADITPADDMEL